VLEGRDLQFNKIKLLKIKNNNKNLILYDKFIKKYNKLKKFYEENNVFYFSFWDVPYGPSFYVGL